MTKRNKVLINRDDVNAKHEKIINLFNKIMTNETNEKKNDDVKFKQKKKILINFETVTTTKEKKMMMKKKISIENDNFQMFKTFNVKNSIKRISAKLIINDTTTFLNIFKISSFDFKKFSK